MLLVSLCIADSSLSPWAMSQLSQQCDGPVDSQLHFYSQDNPTIGRNQALYSPNTPLTTDTAKRYLHSAGSHLTPPSNRALTDFIPTTGLSARLLLVRSTPARRQLLRLPIRLRQELPFQEVVRIIRRRRPVRHQNNRARRRSVWTICWPPRRAIINL